MLLMVIGIFSVMAYAVSLRTHEIGVRMALGAQENSVLRLVLIAGFRLIAAGIFIGFTISYTLTRFLANLISGASAIDPWIFLRGDSSCYVRRSSCLPDPRAPRHQSRSAGRCAL